MTVILNDHLDTLGNWSNLSSATSVAGGLNGNCCQVTGSSARADYTIPTAFQGDVLDCDWWYQASAMTSNCSLMNFLADSAATTHNTLNFASDGSVTVRRGGAAGTILTTSAAGVLTTGTWYHIRFRVKLADVLGQYDVWVNGANVISGTGDTKNAGTASVFDTVRLANTLTGNTGLHDEIVVDIGNSNVPAILNRRARRRRR